jgi:predicted DNA-binding protein
MTTERKKAKEMRVSCRIPPELNERIQKVSQANGIDASCIVRISLNRIIPLMEAGNIPLLSGK